MTYRDAGVDIDAGVNFVQQIAPLAQSTSRRGMSSGIGGFGALFDLRAAGYIDPLLVATTDGVGTKLVVAREVGQYHTVGIDLVAMCVNDLIVQGAEPLLFLDYIATGHLEVDLALSLVSGMVEGCKMAGCALAGGETAEMPGIYTRGDHDLAGFALGAVERNQLLDGSSIEVGDIVIGLNSSGVHSNGYSLIRHIVETKELNYGALSPFDTERTIGECLLEPTRIYVQTCLEVLRKNPIKGLAHITGGGMIENIPRILPKKFSAKLDASTLTPGPIFSWIKNIGGISANEMLRTFNCGIGMIVICPPENADRSINDLRNCGEIATVIGEIVPEEADGRVHIDIEEVVWTD